MPKLNRRQIIIMAVMALALLYGAYDLFFASASKKKAADQIETADDMQAFIQQITTDMAMGAGGEADDYAMGRAESGWLRDPFDDKKIYREWNLLKQGAETAKGSPKIMFNYTGYLDTGRRKMAIINGLEYRVGESLEIEGYLLKSIQPDRVVIHNSRDRTNVEVLLQE
jgi:hypothetical protein